MIRGARIGWIGGSCIYDSDFYVKYFVSKCFLVHAFCISWLADLTLIR